MIDFYLNLNKVRFKYKTLSFTLKNVEKILKIACVRCTLFIEILLAKLEIRVYYIKEIQKIIFLRFLYFLTVLKFF